MFWTFLVIAVIVAIVVVVVFKKRRSNVSTPQEFRENNVQNNSFSNHSEEFMSIYSNIDNMSYEELDKIYEDLLNRVVIKKTALGALANQPEFLEKLQNFDQAPIEGGPIYGCYTNGEALELNQAIVKRLNNYNR